MIVSIGVFFGMMWLLDHFVQVIIAAGIFGLAGGAALYFGGGVLIAIMTTLVILIRLARKAKR